MRLCFGPAYDSLIFTLSAVMIGGLGKVLTSSAIVALPLVEWLHSRPKFCRDLCDSSRPLVVGYFLSGMWIDYPGELP